MTSYDLQRLSSLPTGTMILEKNGHVLEGSVVIDMTATLEAAKILQSHKMLDPFNYTSKAALIEKAINEYHWGLGKRGYHARLLDGDR